ncbi:hypothetical protein CK203_074493 [Vitis vinifera]|uniref:HMA domain-containing protein n=1 Tax=Vitis vinifera TaxID=29760 RepID=A0A438ES78_VITVI|nr:hypothetical protein CK203_074493 [Vitis vinifera]
MEALTRQSLLSSENLAYPSFQVIAMTANLGCACCRQKVFQLTSRMTGENSIYPTFEIGF